MTCLRGEDALQQAADEVRTQAGVGVRASAKLAGQWLIGHHVLMDHQPWLNNHSYFQPDPPGAPGETDIPGGLSNGELAGTSAVNHLQQQVQLQVSDVYRPDRVTSVECGLLASGTDPVAAVGPERLATLQALEHFLQSIEFSSGHWCLLDVQWGARGAPKTTKQKSPEIFRLQGS